MLRPLRAGLTALAVLLAIAVLALAAVPHVHDASAAHECVACATAGAAAAPASAPVVALPAETAEPVVLAPGLAPVAGFPLGAVPGQSPPFA